jgi:hypothetical protein
MHPRAPLRIISVQETIPIFAALAGLLFPERMSETGGQ